MTVDELFAREAIRDCMARCNQAGDRLKADDFADCFTEDGIIQSERAPGDYIFRYVGRSEILAWQNRWRRREPGQAVVHGASFGRHNLSTCTIVMIDATTAKARTYWTAWTDIGPDHSGIYVDDFQRDLSGKWRISCRRIRHDWSSPDSLFISAIENTAE